MDAKIVQVDPSALEIGRNRGSCRRHGRRCYQRFESDDEGSRQFPHGRTFRGSDELREARAAQLVWTENLARAGNPACPVCSQVQSGSMRPDDCLVFDGGDFCHFGRSLLPARKPKRWFYVSSLGMLGSSLPHGAGRQGSLSTTTGDYAHRRWSVWLQWHGIRYWCAIGSTIVAILGNDSAWGIDRQIQIDIRPARGYRVAADALRTGRSRPGWMQGSLLSVRRSPGTRVAACVCFERLALLNVAVQRAISPEPKPLSVAEELLMPSDSAFQS